LNYEVFFYVLFGVGLLLKDRLSTLYACISVLTGMTLCGYLLSPANYLLYYYTDPIILEFAFGVCIGALYTHGPRPPLWLGFSAAAIGIVGLISAGLADLVDDHHVRFLAAGLPAALLVFGATVAKRYQIDPRPPLFVALGDASYSIYLTHVIVVPAAVRLWSFSRLGYGASQMVVFAILAVTFAVAVGWLVHRLVERPLLKWLRRQSSERRPVAQSVSV
jgi:exopolysaccharide production protein ExoZ